MPEDYGDLDAVQVWPDNLPAVTVFLAMSTQWRMGAVGPTGLDYGALREVWQRTRTPPSQRDEVFAQLQIIEREALTTMHSKD